MSLVVGFMTESVVALLAKQTQRVQVRLTSNIHWFALQSVCGAKLTTSKSSFKISSCRFAFFT